MAGLDERDGIDAHLTAHLEAEIANEAQWVVFDDPREEDPWAELQLEEIELAATWWVCVHA